MKRIIACQEDVAQLPPWILDVNALAKYNLTIRKILALAI
jgi:hypothetical protein